MKGARATLPHAENAGVRRVTRSARATWGRATATIRKRPGECHRPSLCPAAPLVIRLSVCRVAILDSRPILATNRRPPVNLSPLGTGTRLVRVGGELVCVAHKHEPTGYKAPGAYGSKVVFDGESTSKAALASVQTIGPKTTKKKLEPYHPLAARNRPKHQTENIKSSRFGVPKGFTETYRNSSQIELGDGHPESRKPWRTTNQIYTNRTLMTGKIGIETNEGIFAECAAMTHSKFRNA